jgi:hypothetical protein
VSADGIFLITEGETLVEMVAAPYTGEEVLQELLARYPNLLAGGQINPSTPRRWLLVAREMGVPRQAGGGDHWSLDHLFLDQDAVPTIVEVKRSTDTRIRREVVGQMLDYAANGVRYWPAEELRARLITRLGSPADADTAVAELLDGVGDVDAFWANVADNLRTGRVRMLFVADRIPVELQRIVEFLNEQMSDAEVLALEVKQYAAEGHRTLVPTLIGRTAAAQQAKRQSDQLPFDELVARGGPDIVELERRLLAWVVDKGWQTTTTSAARKVATADGLHVFLYYPAWSTVEVNLQRLRERGHPELAETLVADLERIAGRRLTRKSPQVPVAGVLAHWETFVDDVLPRYVAALHQPGNGTAPAPG